MDTSDVTKSPGYYFALYGLLSFLLVMCGVMLVYVACSKKYRLNWFEKNLLEAAETAELRRSQEALVADSDSSEPGSSHALNSSEVFWVPPSFHRQTSDGGNSPGISSPVTPSPPLGFTVTPIALMEDQESLTSPGAVSVSRSDKQAALSTTAPYRPRVSSMHTKLDHTKIDTSLYQNTSSSPTPSEPENIRGNIQITLTFDPAAAILSVKLMEANDLQARDLSATADPYAKIRLLPDSSNVWQTRIHKRTLNPVFDEDFVFEVRPATIGRRTLEILVYDFDAYSRHHCIGGMKLPLQNVDLSDRVTLWRALGPSSEQDVKEDELGELMVTLSFLPSAERLTVVVVKARNLRVVDDTRSSSDPYVKVCLLHAGKCVKKRKTSTYRNTVSPVFNEALAFNGVSRDSVAQSSIDLIVYHDSLLGPSEMLGRTVVGPALFQEMIAANNTTTQWLPLKDPL